MRVELIAHYSVTHCDYTQSKSALASVTEVLGALRSVIAELENTEKLVELQEDVSGVSDLVHQGRVSDLHTLPPPSYLQRTVI